ncbi:MAG: zf-HC2 domain-containing protein [Fimbriimonadaceae bacterium]|nr:zf-HC2 domain-containing protein [Fimbriimonadaceae bacterium]
MNCRTAQNIVSAYVDGELCGTEMLNLRSHLMVCKACAAEVEELKAVKRVMGAQPEVEVPAGFEDRLVQFVLADEAPRRRETPVWRLALVSSFAAAACVLVVLQVFGRTTSAQPEMTASTTEQPIAFDVNRDMTYASGSDPFGGQGPVLPASHVAGR